MQYIEWYLVYRGIVKRQRVYMNHILDVRTKEEFESGAVDGAINFPVEDIDRGLAPEIPHNATVYVYCRSGGRSGRAKQLLETLGFKRVVNLGGVDEARQYFERT